MDLISSRVAGDATSWALAVADRSMLREVSCGGARMRLLAPIAQKSSLVVIVVTDLRRIFALVSDAFFRAIKKKVPNKTTRRKCSNAPC